MKYRLAVKIMPVIVVVAIMAATPYFINRGTGGQSDSGQTVMPDVRSTFQTRQTYYKWQDDTGQWHMGDEVPEGVAAIAVEIDTAANILQPLKTATEKPQQEVPAPSETVPQAPGVAPLTVNPADIPGLLDDTQKVKALLENRTQQLQRSTE